MYTQDKKLLSVPTSDVTIAPTACVSCDRGAPAFAWSGDLRYLFSRRLSSGRASTSTSFNLTFKVRAPLCSECFQTATARHPDFDRWNSALLQSRSAWRASHPGYDPTAPLEPPFFGQVTTWVMAGIALFVFSRMIGWLWLNAPLVWGVFVVAASLSIGVGRWLVKRGKDLAARSEQEPLSATEAQLGPKPVRWVKNAPSQAIRSLILRRVAQLAEKNVVPRDVADPNYAEVQAVDALDTPTLYKPIA